METTDLVANSPSDDGRYRRLIEAVTDYAIYMLDAGGIVTTWNPGAERCKGYAPSEIIGQHFLRFYTEDDRRRGIPALALKTAAGTGKFESEGWRVRKDGSRFWAYVVIDPIRDEAGGIIGYAKITRDLTERKAAEDALKQSQQQFRLLVQGVSDYAIYMLGLDGRVSNWNLGARRIKGYEADEIIGAHFSTFYTEEDRAAGMPRVTLETVERDGRLEQEGWRVRKDGSRFWAHVVIDAIRDDDGTPIGYAKITRDITEKRDAQRQLEVAREALLQSQKMEAIGQLTGGIAHDFNNLLMAVLGSLEMMRKRLPDDPKLRMLLDNALQGAQRGSLLTKRLLAFARRQELKQEAVEIPELVRGMTDMLQRSLGPAIMIETHFPLVGKPVLGDANQLEMILLNLTVNARDAMPNGGRIVIAMQEKVLREDDGARLKPGTYICLTVQDSGEGMDEATLQRAMEPFFTTKGLGKGTGLGLSMVHGVTEQSGGWFGLRSRKGEGTTAELWLPVADIGAPAAGHRERPADRPATAQAALVVLAVDDDALVLTNTVAMLEELGHEGIAAVSGKEALEVLRRHGSIDLVITDYAMPHMTGLELAHAIMAEWPDLPVIIATGFAEMESEIQSDLPRLAKPFTEADLAGELERIAPPARKGGRVMTLRAGARSPAVM